ncbi:MAG: aminotransferase class III-fold pyridoxal phosphate-dependent enzyme [Gammaproteobacteria bacterium]|nr:aminotransferase class III-fold pyridoxal phosphate-dependent enzyme [Gammaproteobacteria bacterium]
MKWPFAFKAMQPTRIAAADGVELVLEDGRRILDAAGGAIVANVGHGRRQVADAMRDALLRCSYAVPPWLTPERERLLDRLATDWLPANLTRVHLTCSGSEGVEAALKIVAAYQAARGLPSKTKVIARTPSYHGVTLATLGIGGHESRKAGLRHVLVDAPRVPAPYPLRDPGGDGVAAYVAAIEETITREGPETVAALLAEPIVGSSGGALVPPPDYWPQVRALCDRHDILLVTDEVMTGFGRTGATFALDHFPGTTADVMVAGKGMAGGYAPITGVFATEVIGSAIATAGLDVMFHTFAAQPAACAAADEVLTILTDEDLVRRAAVTGSRLKADLEEAFGQHPHVAEVRGEGLLLAIEIVADRATLARFPASARLSGRVLGEAFARGVSFYPGGNGEIRDVVVMGPPFTITDVDADRIVTTLVAAVDAAVAATNR